MSTEYEQGMATMREVYAGEVAEIPEGALPFNDVMMTTLFAQVWDREVLPIRERRLLLMGAIAARGAPDIWRIQARVSLIKGELSPDELRETLIMLAPYVGYPMVSQLLGPCEEEIANFNERGKDEGSNN